MKRELEVFDSPEQLADHFSDQLMSWIGNSASARMDIAISGGSTPNLLFSALAGKYADAPSWQKVHFWWVDERMVPWEAPDSNFGTARRLLFSQIQLPVTNLHPISGENEPLEEAYRYQQLIRQSLQTKDGWPLFDLVILGMGEDGHTASIFPNQMELFTSDQYCAIALHPVSSQKRITLTGKVLNNAARICFLVTGASKSEPFRQIWENSSGGNALPAARIRPKSGCMTWYCDEAATAKWDGLTPRNG